MPSFPSIQIAESLDVKFYEDSASISQSPAVVAKPPPSSEISDRSQALLNHIKNRKVTKFL